MATKLISKSKKEREEAIEEVSGFKKLSLKIGNEAASSLKDGMATVCVSSIVKGGAKQSLKLVSNNQKAVEKACSRAFPGGGIAAHVAIEGAKVVGKKL